MRLCVVVLNITNLAGYLNNSTEPGGAKIRVDYRQLLSFALAGRACVGALAVAQRDINTPSTHSIETRNRCKKFLYSLQAYGWIPLMVDFDSSSKNVDNTCNQVNESICNLLLEPDGSHKFDLSELDLVFITGTRVWLPVIQPFAASGLCIEITFPKKSTSASLYGMYLFRDLTSFIQSSNVAQRKEVNI